VAVATEVGLFIGGEVVEPASGEIRELREPATDEPLARAAVAGEADVDHAVAAARQALDAIRIANDVRYGLMGTIWTGDPAKGHRIASKIKSGTVGINMPYTAFPGIPFGGYKQSGFGRELSLETLDLYLETKSVVTYTGSRPTNPFQL
jgi:acyl-CoA reductase-like NAD-dependent aldehyde dehydrogenase